MVSHSTCNDRKLFLNSISEGIVAALLATALLTMLWVPYALITNLGRNRFAGGSVRSGLLHEGGGGLILWIMWLVCTAIFTVCVFRLLFHLDN